jgi:CheY-like chemotaxis protein
VHGCFVNLLPKPPGSLSSFQSAVRFLLVNYIKSHPDTADIPVVLLTGADDVDLTQHGVAVGASALLTKPCPADKLRSTIREALARQG